MEDVLKYYSDLVMFHLGKANKHEFILNDLFI